MKFKFVEKVDEEWFFISSDLSVNLAAGWLGVAFRLKKLAKRGKKL